LLVGTGENMGTDVIPSPNRSDQPQKNFEIDPALIIRHHKRTRRGTARIVGHYHSHPDGQALPSSHDQNHNYDPDLVWVIVEVTAEGAQEMKAYFTDRSSGQLTAIPLIQPLS
ncbi:MAG: hypothetical protein GXP02_02240, partial [Alphaproteobacteria bacterium]|nr:hypothetical protein [Alphaproteobacteria bacterium]